MSFSGSEEATSLPVRRPRVGLLVPRFTVFDELLGIDRVAALRAAPARLSDALAAYVDVVCPGIIEDLEAALAARAAFAAADVEAIVVAPPMAAPPELTLAVLDGQPLRGVLWNVVGLDRLADGATQADAVAQTSTVGAQFVAGALARAGGRMPVVSAAPDDPAGVDQLVRTIRASAAVGALRGGTVLTIGAPAPGYANVQCDDNDLASLGLTRVRVEAPELDAAFNASAAAAPSVLEELLAAGVVVPDGPTTLRSAQLAAALEILLDRYDACCGAVADLGPLVRLSETIGIVATLGFARETARGRPIAGTGDVPAAIALLLADRLGGAALFGEWYLSEPSTGTALFLSGGEADPRFAAERTAIRAVPSTSFSGTHGAGLGLDMSLRTGPVTLLALGADPQRWRLAWGTGTLGPARSDHLRGPNGQFAPDGVDVLDAATRLIASGTTHHPVLTPGRLDVEMPVVADLLNAHVTRIDSVG